MLKLCTSNPYYAQNYAGIIYLSLVHGNKKETKKKTFCIFLMKGEGGGGGGGGVGRGVEDFGWRNRRRVREDSVWCSQLCDKLTK